MRWGTIVAATLIALSATAARAEGWCGYAARAKALIECGYSSAADCENAIGKGGMCFPDPDYALNATRPMSAVRHPELATKRAAVGFGRGVRSTFRSG